MGAKVAKTSLPDLISFSGDDQETFLVISSRGNGPKENKNKRIYRRDQGANKSVHHDGG